ncbi:MAG: L-arabinose isomerase, partial [Phycisphaeraceae bacterium]
WFITGSQHLYGPETLKQVEADAKQIADGLGQSSDIPVKVVLKPVLTTPDAIRQLCEEASASPKCVGLIAWMHTFSPAKMWIAGLKALRRPIVHLHTQLGRDIPWADIDMDFMNLHQSAHGGREFGFMLSRLRRRRKVVVGHWQNPDVHRRLGVWCRAAAAWRDQQTLKVARLGDNMRNVAVTEGDKVEAEMRLGYAVNGWGMGDVADKVAAASDADVDKLCGEYEQQYKVVPELKKGGDRHESLRDAARIEIGLRALLEELGADAFTDTFENLTGLKQLPGIAAQRLMADGYGFGAEGDWKTAALVRAGKVMASGLEKDGYGTSFMEDYTYHFDPENTAVLGAHMLEICPSIAHGTPSCEVHPLGIGGKEDPVRLVFTAPPGPAVNASIIDMGERFRLVVNEVDTVTPPADTPKLPVAKALWKPRPDLPTAAECWIHAGGAHHTVFSHVLTAEHFEDFADMADVEFLTIDAETRSRSFRNELLQNDAAYRLR